MNINQENMILTGKVAGDTGSMLSLFGALVGYLPEVAAGVTILWTGLRAYLTWLEIREKRKGDSSEF